MNAPANIVEMPQNAIQSPSVTGKQQRFIAALLQSSTQEAACQAIGISHETARRWLKLPHIQLAYKEARRAAFDETLLVLMTGTAKALSVLLEAMKNGETYAVRVRAAQIWLELAISVHKNEEHEARIAALEEVIEGLKHGR